MLRLPAIAALRHLACKMCTFMLLACLTTSSLNTVPVLFRAIFPATSSAAEEEIHPVVRCDSPRRSQARIRSFSRQVALRRDLPAADDFNYARRLEPPHLSSHLVGSGIRMRC